MTLQLTKSEEAKRLALEDYIYLEIWHRKIRNLGYVAKHLEVHPSTILREPKYGRMTRREWGSEAIQVWIGNINNQ